MKKLFFTLCALCLCGTMWALGTSTTAWTDDDRGTVYQDEASNLYFYVSGSGEDAYANITWSDNSENNYSSLTTLTIPESVIYDGVSYPVTRIAPFAFYLASSIEGEVTIPTNITALGKNAFDSCTGITSVVIEYSSITLNDENRVLYDNAFYNCSNLKNVTLNRNVTSRGSGTYGAFGYQHTIQTIIIGAHVSAIPDFFFRDDKGTTNKSVQSVTCYATYPPEMTEGYNAFNNLWSTAGDVPLYVPEGYEQDYIDAPRWAEVFGENVNKIEGYTPEVEQPEGTLMDVDTHLFFEMNSDGETVSIIADPVETYTDNHLIYVEEGNYYTFPETVTDKSGVGGKVNRIEANAFENSGISGHLYIPAFITAIGAEAFKNSTHITEVTYEYSATAMSDENGGNSTGYTFTSCSGIAKVNIYRDIDIGSGSRVCAPFAWQTAIETVNIGPRVTKLPNYMFRQTSNNPIKTINCYGANPPTLGTAVFDNLGSEYTVNVPQGAENAYASGWSYYTGHEGTLSNAYAVNIYNVDADGDGYATFYDSKAVKLYGDVVAYTVSGVKVDEENNNAYVLMQELGDVIPAGTGALLEGDVAYYTAIEETAVSSETYSGDDYLLGFDDDGQTTVAPNGGDTNNYYFYMLSLNSSNTAGTLAFYWGANNGGTFTCSAHKAYLALDKNVVGTSNIKLKKGDSDAGDTTGISSVEANEGAKVSGIYTIQGVRVSSMSQSGLYIVDGKKVLVK